MNILLKSVKILDPNNAGLHTKKRDILIKGGKIEKIAVRIDAGKGVKTIAKKNLHVSPGWFDGGVNFGEPGFEERETIAHGLSVAARSGFTDVVLHTGTNPVPDSSSDVVFLKSAGKGKATNLHPLGSLTVKSEGRNLAELFDMKNAGATGFYDFKKSLSNGNLLKIALQYVQGFDGLVYSFPLDMEIAGKGVVNEGEVSTKLGLKGIPSLAEELQIVRDLFILEYTGGRLHIPTISTANSVKLISDAKRKGLNVSCSTAIHNLWYTDATLSDFDSNYKTTPPLRTARDVKALIKGVKDGTIDLVITDHTPMNIELKKVEFDHAAYGTIGLESAFGALNTLFGAEATVDILTRARTQYALENPEIKEGAIASISLFDPDETYVFGEEHINSTSKNSIFLNSELKGKAYGIINNGQLIF
ncbi:dihydroorotase [Ulvibacterium sp.]|uniref:dihydroorotase n=1 Tax=Ulvibacterium sp. TaxID=2665914 RepID=UPI003BABCA02